MTRGRYFACMAFFFIIKRHDHLSGIQHQNLNCKIKAKS